MAADADPELPRDERDDHDRRSTDAGLYLYSRLASSLLGLATLGIATHVYPTAAFAYVATILELVARRVAA